MKKFKYAVIIGALTAPFVLAPLAEAARYWGKAG